MDSAEYAGILISTEPYMSLITYVEERLAILSGALPKR